MYNCTYLIVRVQQSDQDNTEKYLVSNITLFYHTEIETMNNYETLGISFNSPHNILLLIFDVAYIILSVQR